VVVYLCLAIRHTSSPPYLHGLFHRPLKKVSALHVLFHVLYQGQPVDTFSPFWFGYRFAIILTLECVFPLRLLATSGQLCARLPPARNESFLLSPERPCVLPSSRRYFPLRLSGSGPIFALPVIAPLAAIQMHYFVVTLIIVTPPPPIPTFIFLILGQLRLFFVPPT